MDSAQTVVVVSSDSNVVQTEGKIYFNLVNFQDLPAMFEVSSILYERGYFQFICVEYSSVCLIKGIIVHI